MVLSNRELEYVLLKLASQKAFAQFCFETCLAATLIDGEEIGGSLSITHARQLYVLVVG
jgi:hypothetical protein